MSKHRWIKLVIDSKTLHVFAKSRVPFCVDRLKQFAGIDLLPATREERKPYLKIKN